MVWIDHDPFFSKGQTTEWNACIGIQSDKETYADGYMNAALELVGNLIDNKRHDMCDSLAMPILYNARHSLELLLKLLIAKFSEARLLPALPIMNHDILELWKGLPPERIGDISIRRYIAELAPFVRSLHAVDVDGQRLRYAETAAGEKSLADRSLCNLEVVRSSLSLLGRLMINLKRRASEFIEERRTGTYTRDCSRSDLGHFARALPPRKSWNSTEFGNIATKLKREFQISSTQFSKALKTIEGNRELGSILGIEFSLLHLTDEKLRMVAREWCTLQSARPEIGRPAQFSSIRIAASNEERKQESLIVQRIAEALSIDEIADLRAIYVIGDMRGYCETYQAQFSNCRDELNDEASVKSKLNHVLGKTIFLQGLTRGLELLGRPRMATELQALRPDLFQRGLQS
jgi:hypothetical protein